MSPLHHLCCRYGLGAVLLAGVLLGLAISKAVTRYMQKAVDSSRTSRENAELRAKASSTCATLSVFLSLSDQVHPLALVVTHKGER